MRCGVFAYNWPHKKTQDILLRLWVEEVDVACVVAMDPVPLNIPPSSKRVKPQHVDLVHPRRVAERMSVPYHEVQHNTSECAEILRDAGVNLGVIAGARILKGPVLDAPTRGILNLHPGLIPEVRGLDALKWAIYEDQPLGVTAHLIDERVDAGRIVLRREIELRPDDTWIDLSLRLYETELNVLPDAIRVLQEGGDEELEVVGRSKKHSKMPEELEAELDEKLSGRKSRLYQETT